MKKVKSRKVNLLAECCMTVKPQLESRTFNQEVKYY